ncbi:MAG: hypothetical protein ACK4MV_03715 [Beijerinckiaceae bacterium]
MDTGDELAPFAHIHALIAEDDALIALDIEQVLITHFGMKVSVVHRLPEGLALMARDPPHIAILDFDLDGAGIEPLARALDEAGTPIIFVSGYRSHPLDPLAHGLKLDKPYAAHDLVGMVEAAVGRLAL